MPAPTKHHPKAYAPLAIARTATLAIALAATTITALAPLASAQPLRPGANITAETPITRVDVVGNGPVNVVMIPGLACDGLIFQDFMSPRTERFRFHAVTLPGMAGTNPPPGVDELNFNGTPWLDNAVNAIAKYMVDEDINDAVLVGHALGGSLAMRVAAAHPQRIAAVVSLDGQPALPFALDQPQAERERFVKANIMPQLLSQSEDDWYRSTDMMASMFTLNEVRNDELAAAFRQTSHPIARRYMLEFYMLDSRAALASNETPILAIASVDQQAASIADQRGGVPALRQRWQQLMRTVPNSELAFAEDCRHFVFDDCPDIIDELMTDFLKRHDIVKPNPEDPASNPDASPIPTPIPPATETPDDADR